MRVADYIFKRLVSDFGVHHTFLVTGGAAMHLNDAIGRCSNLAYTCCHHEQACAMAAEAYARISGGVGVVTVTAGPGAINAVNGVFGAWTDSIPMLILSGQTKRETLMATHGLNGHLRQLGDQECDMMSMVSGITKYAQMITDPSSVRYHLEKAMHLAVHGRPGPVWLDIPVDVQGAQVEPDTLNPFDENDACSSSSFEELTTMARELLEQLKTHQRPLILAGTGVHCARMEELFLEWVEKLGIPVATAWSHDLIPSDHPLFCGRPGTIGTRAGNFVAQNADLVLVLGSRLNIRQTSYHWKSCFRNAKVIHVDIDPHELEKPTFRATTTIHADLAELIPAMLRVLPEVGWEPSVYRDWLDWCRERSRLLPSVQERQRDPSRPINAYAFMETLFDLLDETAVIACGDATACIVPFQVGRVKKGQRMFSNSGCASMGYDLPAAIGAAVAAPGRPVICLAGDGSIQMNLQELQTIAHHGWPIKIFVLANGGYLSIRQTQENFFKQSVGAGPGSGVTFPDMVKVAGAYGLHTLRLDALPYQELLKDFLSMPGPALCQVHLDQTQEFEPRLKSRVLADGSFETPPLEDMFPFLSREEFLIHQWPPKP